MAVSSKAARRAKKENYSELGKKLVSQQLLSKLAAVSLALLKSRNLKRLISLVLFFGIWQLLCATQFNFFINFAFLPSPVDVWNATLEFFSGNAMVHITASVQRVLLGFGIAAALGISLGILIGWFHQI